MLPAEWHARGIRILARAALEAVRGPLGERIGWDVAQAASTASAGSASIAFAGSCNALI